MTTEGREGCAIGGRGSNKKGRKQAMRSAGRLTSLDVRESVCKGPAASGEAAREGRAAGGSGVGCAGAGRGVVVLLRVGFRDERKEEAWDARWKLGRGSGGGRRAAGDGGGGGAGDGRTGGTLGRGGRHEQRQAAAAVNLCNAPRPNR